MENKEFIKRMKESDFSEKEISNLIMVARRDLSDLQSDVKDLSLRYYRIIYSFLFIFIVMAVFLFLGSFDGRKIFLFSIFFIILVFLFFITPVKLSYKSHRMYKNHM